MFVCCSLASARDSPARSAETLSTTKRPARFSCVAKNTRPNAPLPISRTSWKPYAVSPGFGIANIAVATRSVCIGKFDSAIVLGGSTGSGFDNLAVGASTSKISDSVSDFRAMTEVGSSGVKRPSVCDIVTTEYLTTAIQCAKPSRKLVRIYSHNIVNPEKRRIRCDPYIGSRLWRDVCGATIIAPPRELALFRANFRTS